MLNVTTLLQLARWFAPNMKIDESGPFLELSAKAGQPSDTPLPVEILGLGLKMFSRGLYTSLVHMTRTDWKWPYWLRRQSDPADNTFQAVAHAIITQNRIHRNWTLLGMPEHENRLVVDPALMVTPQRDGYSIEFWIQEGDQLFELFDTTQKNVEFQGDEYVSERFPIIRRQIRYNHQLSIRQNIFCGTVDHEDAAYIRIKLKNLSKIPVSVSVWMAIRPYNPEGIAPIYTVKYDQNRQLWMINGRPAIFSATSVTSTFTGNGQKGDTWSSFTTMKPSIAANCAMGLVNAAGVYQLTIPPNDLVDLDFTAMMEKDISLGSLDWDNRDLFDYTRAQQRFYYRWNKQHEGKFDLLIPDKRLQQLTHICLNYLSVFTRDKEVLPGYLIYDDFWFRDSAYLMHVMLKCGYHDAVRRIIRSFPSRQNEDGFFESQEGEWDSNGEALWIVGQTYRYTRDKELVKSLWPSLMNGAKWINRKRMANQADPDVAELMPAGFSAEHFGANDYYFWDNFWSLAGIREMVYLAEMLGFKDDLRWLEIEYQSYRTRLQTVLNETIQRFDGILSASPKRGFDAAAIGNLVVVYPLQMEFPLHPAIKSVKRRLLQEFSSQGCFYHPIAHTGINIYLTLHLRHLDIYERDTAIWKQLHAVADLATPTGTWPEALHPIFKSGVMGEGHHGWANAEWISAIQDSLLCVWDREVWITPVFRPEWFEASTHLDIDHIYTPFGKASFHLHIGKTAIRIDWTPEFFEQPERIIWWLPDFVVLETPAHFSRFEGGILLPGLPCSESFTWKRK